MSVGPQKINAVPMRSMMVETLPFERERLRVLILWTVKSQPGRQYLKKMRLCPKEWNMQNLYITKMAKYLKHLIISVTEFA